jgi:hypothetical protein
LKPALEGTLTVRRQMPGESLELEVALGAERVAHQKLRQLVHLAGAECDIDERKALEHLLLDGLRPAAADPDDSLRPLSLQALGRTEMRNEAAVGGLSDRAGVEEDQIRLIALLRLLIAERMQHPLHPLGVVLVHLTPEGGEVIALHGP